MAVIIDNDKRVMVQGITGREGRARTRLMKNFGTNIVGGCTPGRGGQEVEGILVHDTVKEVVDAAGGEVDISVVFVPARLVKTCCHRSHRCGGTPRRSRTRSGARVGCNGHCCQSEARWCSFYWSKHARCYQPRKSCPWNDWRKCRFCSRMVHTTFRQLNKSWGHIAIGWHDKFVRLLPSAGWLWAKHFVPCRWRQRDWNAHSGRSPSDATR